MDEPHLAQIAWAVLDLPRACRFYTDVLGFRRAGGRVLWGPGLSVLQELGDDAAATLWWAVGGQRFVQLEFFHHSLPAGRPRRADARASDLGWSRVTIGVPDLDAVLERAARAGHRPIGPVVRDAGIARAALRDPDGVVVELIGDGGEVPAPAAAGGAAGAGVAIGATGATAVARPAVRAVALGVADLEGAARFWIELCGLAPQAPDVLHDASHEALFGLEGARREIVAARGGEVLLELVRYDPPHGRPQPADRRLCDQGLLNAALAFRDRARFDALLDRLRGAGHRATVECPPGPFASTYLRDGEGNSFELFASPEDHDALLGFVPETGFAPGTPLDP
ncbi:MAG: VOC family protein [Myxococcota bacterium]